jgi:hypothetical protein
MANLGVLLIMIALDMSSFGISTRSAWSHDCHGDWASRWCLAISSGQVAEFRRNLSEGEAVKTGERIICK